MSNWDLGSIAALGSNFALARADVTGGQVWNLGTFTPQGFNSCTVDAQQFVDWDLGSFTAVGTNSATVYGSVPTDWDLGSFTMLGTNACTVQSGTIWQGAADLDGDSAVMALLGFLENASAALTGQGAVTATASTSSAEDIAATLVAKALFFVNPANVLVIPFFRNTPGPGAGAGSVQLNKAQPGILSSNVTIGTPVHTRNSQTGGVPNKG